MIGLCLFNTFLLPFQTALSPVLTYNQWRKDSCPEVSQRKANEICLGPSPPLAAWLSDFLSTIACSIYVSFYYPISLPIGLIGCFLHFWMQKYAILRICRRLEHVVEILPFRVMSMWNYLIIL